MIKFRLYFDKDKETAWLNEMSERGLDLVSFFMGFYVFKKSGCKHIYQIDLGSSLFSSGDEYRGIMQDAGIEIVQHWGYWVIMRKPKSEGEFELYTDIESKIAHYVKIRKMFRGAALFELICLFIVLLSAAMLENVYGILGVSLLTVFEITFICIINKTTKKINELKEEQTGIAAEKEKEVSIFIITGLLLNSCAILLKGEFSDYSSLMLQVIAVILMLVGIWDACKKND